MLNLAAEQYASQSHTRNLCMSWPDGRRIFLNYSYLVAAEYLPPENSIALSFTTHTVKIKGLRLEALFVELMDHLPRIITCTEERYKVLADENAPSVQEIIVTAIE